MRRRWVLLTLLAIVLSLMLVTRVPAALAFPYSAQIGSAAVLSEKPIPPLLISQLARADRSVTAAGIDGADRPHQIVLTKGGRRWRILALRSSGAFGLRQPFSSVLIFNRSDVPADRVVNGRTPGGDRSLSGTIAHEMTHWLMAARLGEIHAATQPAWKWEGFADHVAQESSLSDAEAIQARRRDPDHPALIYYDARRRVAAALARDPSIDRLFGAD